MAATVPAQVAFLVDAARAAPSADNSQPWRFEWSGRLEVHYRATEAQRAFMPADHPGTLLSLGALIENLHQAGHAIGVEPIDTPTAVVEGQPLLVVDVPANPEACPIDNLPLFGRHTNRFPYRPLAPRALDLVRGQTEQGSARCELIDGAEARDEMSDMVRLASEVRFRTRDIHEWLYLNLRFTPEEVERGDGLDVATLDLPPGGKQLLRFIAPWNRMARLNAWGAYKGFARMEARAVANAPALVAIIGDPRAKGALEAGRLLERTWIELNRLGFAVQPYFAITDQLHRLASGAVPPLLLEEVVALRRRVKDVLHLAAEESLLMLLRVGASIRAPATSRRLPRDVLLRSA